MIAPSQRCEKNSCLKRLLVSPFIDLETLYEGSIDEMFVVQRKRCIYADHPRRCSYKRIMSDR